MLTVTDAGHLAGWVMLTGLESMRTTITRFHSQRDGQPLNA